MNLYPCALYNLKTSIDNMAKINMSKMIPSKSFCFFVNLEGSVLLSGGASGGTWGRCFVAWCPNSVRQPYLTISIHAKRWC